MVSITSRWASRVMLCGAAPAAGAASVSSSRSAGNVRRIVVPPECQNRLRLSGETGTGRRSSRGGVSGRTAFPGGRRFRGGARFRPGGAAGGGGGDAHGGGRGGGGARGAP